VIVGNNFLPPGGKMGGDRERATWGKGGRREEDDRER